jgi:hypothetical protein
LPESTPRERKRALLWAVVCTVAAAICLINASILQASPNYGVWAWGFQLLLFFLWAMAASRAWFRWGGKR